MTLDVLFEPVRIKSLALRNRIVMAPMTRRAAPGGVPTSELAAYYRRRAEGGVGLILTEGTSIARPAAKNEPDVPDFHGEAALAGWARVAAEVHAAGGRVAPQLWHTGAFPSTRFPDWRPAPVDSPSGLLADGTPYAAPMDEAAIADTIAAFAAAAAAAERLGFDAVELHAAHGYLIDQFFWAAVNRRDDCWGGRSLVERSRFAVEIVRAVRAAVAPDTALSLRLSQWKIQAPDARLAETPQEMAAWLEPLADAGVDIFHCSQRCFWTPEFPGSSLNFAGWAKKLTGKAAIAVGQVGLGAGGPQSIAADAARLPDLARMLERGEFDLAAVGRALIANPNWPVLIAEGRYTELAGFERKALEILA